MTCNCRKYQITEAVLLNKIQDVEDELISRARQFYVAPAILFLLLLNSCKSVLRALH